MAFQFRTWPSTFSTPVREATERALSDAATARCVSFASAKGAYADAAAARAAQPRFSGALTQAAAQAPASPAPVGASDYARAARRKLKEPATAPAQAAASPALTDAADDVRAARRELKERVRDIGEMRGRLADVALLLGSASAAAGAAAPARLPAATKRPAAAPAATPPPAKRAATYPSPATHLVFDGASRSAPPPPRKAAAWTKETLLAALRAAGVRPQSCSPCALAGLLKGRISWAGTALTLDAPARVAVAPDGLRAHDASLADCTHEWVPTLRELLMQPAHYSEETLHATATVKCGKGLCASGLGGVCFITGICTNDFTVDNGAHLVHCTDCPGFGACFEAARANHCFECGGHYVSCRARTRAQPKLARSRPPPRPAGGNDRRRPRARVLRLRLGRVRRRLLSAAARREGKNKARARPPSPPLSPSAP